MTNVPGDSGTYYRQITEYKYIYIYGEHLLEVPAYLVRTRLPLQAQFVLPQTCTSSYSVERELPFALRPTCRK